jgi:hypothetical protein
MWGRWSHRSTRIVKSEKKCLHELRADRREQDDTGFEGRSAKLTDVAQPLEFRFAGADARRQLIDRLDALTVTQFHCP